MRESDASLISDQSGSCRRCDGDGGRALAARLPPSVADSWAQSKGLTGPSSSTGPDPVRRRVPLAPNL